ncbi:hypothetical protein BT69DRAFT_1212664 [Atractiella rhizophila]|nr:hypothetical protein BT69DRAFT_1212664 [Atractiella rhizophila]
MDALKRRGKDGKDHFFHGRRRYSFITHDIDELTELRARERTFDGAYIRTSLVMLTYALIFLKIFSPEFARIGICYIIISFVLLVISLLRRSHSNHDLADVYKPKEPHREAKGGTWTSGMIWGRAFRTSGRSVLLLSALVGALEVTLLVLVWRLRD